MRISDWSSDVCSSDLKVDQPQENDDWHLQGEIIVVGSRRRAPGARSVGTGQFGIGAGEVVDPHPSGVGVPESLGNVQIGRASCRERVCQYVSISVVAESSKQKNSIKNKTRIQD